MAAIADWIQGGIDGVKQAVNPLQKQKPAPASSDASMTSPMRKKLNFDNEEAQDQWVRDSIAASARAVLGVTDGRLKLVESRVEAHEVGGKLIEAQIKECVTEITKLKAAHVKPIVLAIIVSV
jgi:hypothetical protein